MHKCSKHVEAWNKLIVKQKFCASSWLITKIDGIYLFIYFYSVFFGVYDYINSHLCVEHMWYRAITDVRFIKNFCRTSGMYFPSELLKILLPFLPLYLYHTFTSVFFKQAGVITWMKWHNIHVPTEKRWKWLLWILILNKLQNVNNTGRSKMYSTVVTTTLVMSLCKPLHKWQSVMMQHYNRHW